MLTHILSVWYDLPTRFLSFGRLWRIRTSFESSRQAEFSGVLVKTQKSLVIKILWFKDEYRNPNISIIPYHTYSNLNH